MRERLSSSGSLKRRRAADGAGKGIGIDNDDTSCAQSGKAEGGNELPREFIFPSVKGESEKGNVKDEAQGVCDENIARQARFGDSSSMDPVYPYSSSTTLVPSSILPQDPVSAATGSSTVASRSRNPLPSHRPERSQGSGSGSTHRPSRLNLGSITNHSRERERSRYRDASSYRDRSRSIGRKNSGGTPGRLARGDSPSLIKLGRTRTRTFSGGRHGGQTVSSELGQLNHGPGPYSTPPTHHHSHSHSLSSSSNLFNTSKSHTHAPSSSASFATSPSWTAQYHTHGHSHSHSHLVMGPRSAKRWARSAHLHHVKRMPGAAAALTPSSSNANGFAAMQSAPWKASEVVGGDEDEHVDVDVFGSTRRIDRNEVSTPVSSLVRDRRAQKESVSPVLSNGGMTDGWVDTDGDTEDDCFSADEVGGGISRADRRRRIVSS
jgi:hypothetical protein